MKWTAFDHETAAALAAHLPNVEISQGVTDELDAALAAATASASAVVMPAQDGEHALFVTMRTKDPNADTEPHVPVQPTSYQAGGFLGLADEPVFEDEKTTRRR